MYVYGSLKEFFMHMYATIQHVPLSMLSLCIDVTTNYKVQYTGHVCSEEIYA